MAVCSLISRMASPSVQAAAIAPLLPAHIPKVAHNIEIKISKRSSDARLNSVNIEYLLQKIELVNVGNMLV